MQSNTTTKKLAKIIPEKEEKLAKDKAFKKALKYFNKKNYSKAIGLLQPFFHEKDKRLDTDLLNLLANSYMLAISCVSEKKKFALPIWKILFSNAMLQKDYKSAITSLYPMIACYQDDPKEREVFTQIALKILTDHQKELTFKNEWVVSDLIKMRYSFCFTAGMFNATSGNQAEDMNLQKVFFAKAKEYYAAALAQIPADLQCLLYLARLIVAEKCISIAIDTLLLHANQYKNNISYIESMRKLYEALKDDSKVEEYKKRASSLNDQDELSFIFDDLGGTTSAADNSPLEKYRLAFHKYTKNEISEAKSLVTDILSQHPNHVTALELSVELHKKSGDFAKIPELCERILTINPISIVALITRADFLWKFKPDEQPNEDHQTAYTLYEKAYNEGVKSESLIANLIFISLKIGKNQKVIEYAQEDTRLRPSPMSYFALSVCYAYEGDYEKAVTALKKVRQLDNNYKNSEVSIYIIYCMLKTASTQEQFKACAKKLNSYITHHKLDQHGYFVNSLIQTFKELNIDIPHISSKAEKQVVNEEKSTPNEQDTSWTVPEEIKTKIKDLLQSNKNIFTLPIPSEESHRYDPLAEIEEKEVKLYPIGGNQSGIFGYIDPKAKTNSVEEAKIFQRVLEEDCRLLSGSSKGISGAKTLIHKEKYHLKPSGYSRRMGSTAKFFRKRPDGAPGPETQTIIRFGKVTSK